MNPRKKESKKWSALPSELTKQIKSVFEETFAGNLEGKSLKVEGRIYPTEILMRIGINAKGELRYHNFEVSVDHSQEKQDTVAKINLAVDAIASLMADYFINESEHDMPLTWHEYPFEKHKIWLQYTSTNSDLEAQANKLLGIEDEDALIIGAEDEVELEALESDEEIKDEKLLDSDEDAVIDDDEVDTSRPKIFRVATDNPQDTLKKKKKEEMH